MSLPPKPGTACSRPGLPPRPPGHPTGNPSGNPTGPATGERLANRCQSESDLRDQATPPKRPGLSPSAHDQKQGALSSPGATSRLSPQEKVLVRWELFSQPSISRASLMVPGNTSLANKAWDWASSLGGESPRWKRFLRVVRIRALGYRIAGARGDVAIKAMADVAQAIDAVSPIKNV